VASTSVAICDESPQLQSNGPTVTKEKYIVAYIFCAYLIVSRIMKLILNKINSSGEIHFGKNIKINKDDWKLNYPLNPVHKRSAPTLHVATRQRKKPSPDEKKKKKHLPIDNFGRSNYLLLTKK
jgi:hypothetical protein